MSSLLFSHNIEYTNQVRFIWIQSPDKDEKAKMTSEDKMVKYSSDVNDCFEYSIFARIPDLKFSPNSLACKLSWALNRWYRDTALHYQKVLSLPSLQNADQFQDLPWLRCENNRYFIECFVQCFSFTAPPRFCLRRFSLDQILGDEQLLDLLTNDFRKIIVLDQECIYVHRRIEEDESLYKIQESIKHLNEILALDKIPLSSNVKIEASSPVHIDEDFTMHFEDEVIQATLTEKEYLREENARLQLQIEDLQKCKVSQDEKLKMMSEAWQYEQNQHILYSRLAASITKNYLELKWELEKKQKAMEDIKILTS